VLDLSEQGSVSHEWVWSGHAVTNAFNEGTITLKNHAKPVNPLEPAQAQRLVSDNWVQTSMGQFEC